MLDPRWRKVLRDAWLHRMRTLLVVLAIAVGLLGAGSVLDAWSLVRLATAAGYSASQPVSGTLRIDPLDKDLLEEVRRLPGIAAVRARRTIPAAMQDGGQRKTVVLYALDDFARADIGRLLPLSGRWPPADGGIVIENASLGFSGAAVGEKLTLFFSDGLPRAVPVTGILRDVSLPPGWMDHLVDGFVTPGTLASLGLPSDLNELQFRVTDPAADRDAVRRLAFRIKALAEQRGSKVGRIDVPVPRQHPHAAQMESLMATQGAFGGLSLLVCGFLIFNLITAMLAGQVREIGVMKAIGAGSGQLSAMYLALALGLGLLASAIAVPLAAMVGRRYGAMQGEMLNFPIETLSIPLWAYAAQVLVGALLPVAAAGIPVLRGCRLPVVAALRDQGLHAANGTMRRRLLPFTGLGRPMLLSINNAFRRRQRLLLTLLALASGGAVFLGAEGLRSAVQESVGLLFAQQHYDVVLRLGGGQAADKVETLAASLPGVKRVEAWATVSAAVSHDGDIIGNGFGLIGLPPRSPMVSPALLQGHWLSDSGDGEMVVGSALLKDEPGLQPGASVALSIDGKPTRWTVVGIVESGPIAVAYAARPVLEALRGDDHASTLVAASTSADPADQLGMILQLRDAFSAAGIPVTGSERLGESRRAVEDHLVMVSDFLGAMSWVMIIVGGMGLASTMSLALLERTREIGVMRAIGASRRAILMLFLGEGLAVALLAWLVALPLSAPMNALLATSFGRIMFAVPVHLIPGSTGMLKWLALAIVISVLASVLPGLRATRIAAAKALAYE